MKPDYNMPIEKAKYLVACALHNYIRHYRRLAEYNEIEATEEEIYCHRMDLYIAWDKVREDLFVDDDTALDIHFAPNAPDVMRKERQS